MSSSSSAAAWAPKLDLTANGLGRFDPARVEQAVADGYRAGYEAGRAEAREAGEAAIADELGRIRAEATTTLAALARTEERLGRIEQESAAAFAGAVADAAVQVAAAVLGRELADETVAATSAVERVLGALGRRPGTVVRLHPDDVALLDQAHLPDGVRLEADPGLARGDAVGQTDDRTVDARISAALGRALAALAGGEEST